MLVERRPTRRLMNQINVVPYIDVMLVLLVIFMVAAPMMTQGFAVNLPQSRRATAITAEPVYITVGVNFRKDGQVQLAAPVHDEGIGVVGILDAQAVDRDRAGVDGQHPVDDQVGEREGGAALPVDQFRRVRRAEPAS